MKGNRRRQTESRCTRKTDTGEEEEEEEEEGEGGIKGRESWEKKKTVIERGARARLQQRRTGEGGRGVSGGGEL